MIVSRNRLTLFHAAILLALLCLIPAVDAQDSGSVDSVHVETNPDTWVWSASWGATNVGISDASSQIDVNGIAYPLGPIASPTEATVQDELGSAKEISALLGAGNLPVEVTFRLRRYDEQGLVAIQGEVANNSGAPVSLGDFTLVAPSRVALGQPARDGRAYIERSPGHPTMEAFVSTNEDGTEAALDADSSGMVTIGSAAGPAFTAGFITAQNCRPVVYVRYAADTDETFISCVARFHGRQLDAGEHVDSGWLVLRSDTNPLNALETYGDLLARALPPRTTPATIGWCS
ncbi:MAG: hypothetical protein KJ060_21570, partial [Candidatus Hydrogenedentes bacterium]|nr:hypothetical protein [Candidatus Hydrogenedentota bacterium]